MKIILIGFILRIILAHINVYYVPIPGSENDAINFHKEAVLYAEYLSGNITEYEYRLGWMYSVFLGIVFFILGDSMILASLLSCVVWLLSALVFRTIMVNLRFNKNHITLALLFYTFALPISFVYSSFILREVYILLFINLLILSIIKFDLAKKNKDKFISLIILFFSILLLTLFHKGNIIFCFLFLFSLIIFYIQKNNKINFELLMIFSLIIVALIQFDFFEKVFKTIYGYQHGHFDRFAPSRADYVSWEQYMYLEFSFVQLIKIISSNIYNYFLQPTIFRATTFIDLIAVYENILRFIIILICTIKLFMKFNQKNFFIFMFLALMIMELIYSQATINWGSATRHHMPTVALLFLMLFFPIRNK